MYYTIITATYNAAMHLKEAFESLKHQHFNDYEHIIVDGASTDNTMDIVEASRNEKTKVFSEPDNGMYDALNKGIRLASGKVIGFLHADDVYSNNTVLQKVFDAFEKENSDAVYGDLEYVWKDNSERVLRRWKSQSFTYPMLKNGWMPPHPTFFVKKAVYDQYGLFDTSMRISADYEIMMRFLAKHKISAAYVPEVLVKMKTGGTSNRSISNILIKSYEDYIAMKRYNVGGFRTLLMKNFSKIKQFI